MSVIPGNPATQADEADVALSVSISDVRRKSDLADYGGELEARTTLRLTDRLQRRGAGRERDARRPPLRVRGAVCRDGRHRDRIDVRALHERRGDHPGHRRRGQPRGVAARPGDGRRRRVRRARLDRPQRRVRRAGRVRALITHC